MARATVQRETRPLPPIQTVTLELTLDEASLLVDICDRCSGDPVYIRRRLTDGIGDALRLVNVPRGAENDMGGSSLRFADR